VGEADGDVLIAIKPHLASFGAGLIAAEQRQVPLILDHDDLDVAFTPRADWAERPSMADLRRPSSAIYVSLLTKASPGATAITVASTALQKRFGGALLQHGSLTELFDPGKVNREKVRSEFGFAGPTVLFAGTPRGHKGLKPLAKAVSRIPGAKVAVLCRPEDLSEAYWKRYALLRLPMISYRDFPKLLAAADVIAIPQLDTEISWYQMPMKVYDCMAMAKPIVASAISDLPALLEGCGRLAPPGDLTKLREAIADLLNNPAEARALGDRARTRCLEQYSMQRIGEKLRQVVERVLVESTANTK
jgi:glycosyltransferase involved in cell wall biosynthesis